MVHLKQMPIVSSYIANDLDELSSEAFQYYFLPASSFLEVSLMAWTFGRAVGWPSS